MTDEPEFVAKTLAWCNARRAEKGKKPLKKLPKGYPEDPTSCPCGKATGLYVDYREWGPDRDRRLHVLPKPVVRFVEAFDSGELPQYEKAV